MADQILASGSVTLAEDTTPAKNAASEAAKTATNYMTETEDGVLIIKRDTDDYSVRIDADSLDIMNGDILVASFGYDNAQNEPFVEMNEDNAIYGERVLKISPSLIDMTQSGALIMQLGTDGMYFGEDVKLDGAVNFAQGASGLLARTTHTISLGNMSSGASKDGTLNITKSGYYPMAIAGFNCGSSYLVMQQCNLSNTADGSATINYRVRNVASSQASSPTLTVHVLWMKYRAAQ